MSNARATTIFTFFFIIPYLCAQLMIGVAYNALVFHSNSLWRSLIGALVGATVLYFAKIPLERPLRILGKYTTVPLIHLTVRFFMLLEARPLKVRLNYGMDLLIALGSTYLIRAAFPGPAGLGIITGSLFGWLLGVLFVSICIGAYLDFEVMSLVPDPKGIKNAG